MKVYYKIFSVIIFFYLSIGINFILPQTAFAFGPQSSNKNIEWDFDFVEEFDGLQDWIRTEGNVGHVTDVNKLPKLSNGSTSAWDYYSSFSNTLPTQNWISTYGDNRVWRGTKSAAIDMNGGEGPSRLGLYDADGYQDFYFFFMANIPKNEWPTSCVGGNCNGGAVGTYTAGQPYSWFSSWQFVNFNIGCASSTTCKPYSSFWHQAAHITQYNYGTAPGLTMRIEDPTHVADQLGLDGGINLNNFMGDWMGFEFHITQSATQTFYTVWVYDKNGNSTKILDNKVWPTPAEAQGKLWNHLFLGGSNSGVYKWGDTMKSVYFIDDVIIDNQRIGVKYFNLINGETPPTPDTIIPSTPTGLISSGITNTSVILNWNTSTDNVGVTGYKIYRDGTLVTTVTATNYTNTGLTANTNYLYTITAIDAAGNESAASSSKQVTTTGATDTTAPSIPAGLISSGITSSSATLTWVTSTDSVGVTGYKIYKNNVLLTSTSQTTYSDTGLIASTDYSYTVSAYDSAGNESAKSSILTITTLAASSGSLASFGPQSSNKNVLWDFDFVEEFDGLQDWIKTNPTSEGNVGEYDADWTKMPHLQNGSKSAWNYYSSWSTGSSTKTWIGAYGDNRVWRGTKSATIDIGDSAEGPSRLGMVAPEGYSDTFYYFFMVNIPKNEFPTSCVGGSCQGGAVGTYTEGQPYAYFASWKFMTFNYGCGGLINCWDHNPPNNGYSPFWHIISHIKWYGYNTYSPYGIVGGIDAPGIFFKDEEPPGGSDKQVYGVFALENLNDRLGDWFGVEYKIEQVGCVTKRTTWIYDQLGNVVNVIPTQDWTTINCDTNRKWDYFFHGGNNSGTYNWGSTMKSAYNIDDVIIDDKRIGPKYFTYISDSPVTDTVAPTGSINIDNNNSYSNNENVDLSISATDSSGVSEMKISNSNNISETIAEAYNTVKSWTLSSINGLKTVYVWFKDTVGNWNSTPYSDTIILDTASPVISNITNNNITSSAVTIAFNTNESATSYIQYGLTSSYGTQTAVSNILQTFSLPINSLSANTTYHYRVVSTDQYSNTSQSTDRTFKTLADIAPDTTPPANITDLTANNITQTSADITWTSQGDDNNIGTASKYDLRYSTSNITVANWNSATQLSGEPIPKMAGSKESMYVAIGLAPNTKYYFAIKAEDEVPNVSGLSNIISFTTLTPQVTPPTNGGGAAGGGGGGGGGLANDTTPPEKPKSFKANSADSQIILTWKNPNDADFVRSTLLRLPMESSVTIIDPQTFNGCPVNCTNKDIKVVYEGTNQEYTDIALNNDSKYAYAIYAYDRKPNYSIIENILAAPIAGKENTDIPDNNEIIPDDKCPTELNSLYGISGDIANCLSKKESIIVDKYNKHTPLNKIEAEIYNKINNQTTAEDRQKLVLRNKYSIAMFINQGTRTTRILGAGERAGIIDSFRAAFGKLPKTESDWQNVIKIGNGRWPSETNIEAEDRAKIQFKKVYQRDAVMTNTHDNAAITIMAYGLRPANRNLASEKAGIKTFKAIYGYNPTNAIDWNIARAISYSGAVR